MIRHDMHVHTFLSSCSKDEEATGDKIVQRAEEVGLEVIGFADHMWCSKIPGAAGSYIKQNYEHMSKIRELIPEDTKVKVLIGCETEYCGNGKLGISKETAAKLDFVLIPFSHFHKDIVKPADVEEPADRANLLVERFIEVTDIRLPVPIGVAHPFSSKHEVLEKITDSQLKECFSRAAEAGFSIEIKSFALRNEEAESYYGRIFRTAKECGCFFHLGSDSHQLEKISSLSQMDPALERLGITEEDIWPFVRGQVKNK